MQQTLNWIVTGLLVILFIDFIGFAAWVASGQFPVDNFYVGAITKNLLTLIIK